MFQRLGKILVRVKTPVGEYYVVRKILPDGKSVLIQKESKRKKRGPWKVSFNRNSLYMVKRYGFKKMMCIDVIQDSPKAVSYDYEAKKALAPLYDRQTEYKIVNADIIKQRGEGLKLSLPPIFWMIFGVGLIAMCGVLYLIYQLVL